jgi:hypothetical protein
LYHDIGTKGHATGSNAVKKTVVWIVVPDSILIANTSEEHTAFVFRAEVMTVGKCMV